MRPELEEHAFPPVRLHLERAYPAAGADERAHVMLGGGLLADDDEVRVVELEDRADVDVVVLGDEVEIGLATDRLPDDVAQKRCHIYEHDPRALQPLPPRGTGRECRVAPRGSPWIRGSVLDPGED